VKVGIGEPDQVPLEVVRTCPSVVVPLITGATLLAGEIPEIVEVAAEIALEEPWEFEAVTTTSTVFPVSVSCKVYVLEVAPAMLEQPAPTELQLCHW
jgi:hypothetical protein